MTHERLAISIERTKNQERNQFADYLRELAGGMMAIQCSECGRFISYSDMDGGKAVFEYVPETDYSEEQCLWTCYRCEGFWVNYEIDESLA